jgi:Uma2 family endonuclease
MKLPNRARTVNLKDNLRIFLPMVTLQLRQLEVPPGQRLLIRDVDWLELEAVLQELGEERSSRIAYSERLLEIRMPLPKREKAKSILGDGVKILLEELGLDCECFGSTTFKRQEMGYGIEPDECFYIQNHGCMVGKDRIDLAVDPPPDLAIEVDITSKTQTSAYLKLQVPELWIYGDDRLKIYRWVAGIYQEMPQSSIFSGLPIVQLCITLIEESLTIGRSPALRKFRQQVRDLMGD